MTLAFVHSPLARDAQFRNDANALGELRKDAVVIEVTAAAVRLEEGRLHHVPGPSVEADLLLGRGPDGDAYFARKAVATEGLTGLRDVMLAGTLPHGELSLLAQACSMIGWHDTHGFCAACGAATQMADAGYRRHCETCGKDHFPRTDPVVIMAVTHERAVLLGRQSSWRPGMYSALAGFMEPGETIEQAAAREVFEEAGVVIHDATYVTSQPWPFPSSIMIGLVAKAQSRTLQIDHSEIEDARWFEKDELVLMLKGTHPDGLTATNPYAIAHHIIHAAVNELG